MSGIQQQKNQEFYIHAEIISEIKLDMFSQLRKLRLPEQEQEERERQRACKKESWEKEGNEEAAIARGKKGKSLSCSPLTHKCSKSHGSQSLTPVSSGEI